MATPDKPGDFVTLCQINDEDHGIIRLMKQPEGYVLWCGGVIVWKSKELKRSAEHDYVYRA